MLRTYNDNMAQKALDTITKWPQYQSGRFAKFCIDLLDTIEADTVETLEREHLQAFWIEAIREAYVNTRNENAYACRWHRELCFLVKQEDEAVILTEGQHRNLAQFHYFATLGTQTPLY